jgi:hypothetical protein
MIICRFCGNFEMGKPEAWWLERLLWIVLLRPYRCLRCHRKQYHLVFRRNTSSAHRIAASRPETNWGTPLHLQNPDRHWFRLFLDSYLGVMTKDLPSGDDFKKNKGTANRTDKTDQKVN